MLSLGKIVLITQTPSRAQEVSLTKLYLFWNRNTSTKIKTEKIFFTLRTLKSEWAWLVAQLIEGRCHNLKFFII